MNIQQRQKPTIRIKFPCIENGALPLCSFSSRPQLLTTTRYQAEMIQSMHGIAAYDSYMDEIHQKKEVEPRQLAKQQARRKARSAGIEGKIVTHATISSCIHQLRFKMGMTVIDVFSRLTRYISASRALVRKRGLGVWILFFCGFCDQVCPSTIRLIIKPTNPLWPNLN